MIEISEFIEALELRGVVSDILLIVFLLIIALISLHAIFHYLTYKDEGEIELSEW